MKDYHFFFGQGNRTERYDQEENVAKEPDAESASASAAVSAGETKKAPHVL